MKTEPKSERAKILIQVLQRGVGVVSSQTIEVPASEATRRIEQEVRKTDPAPYGLKHYATITR